MQPRKKSRLYKALENIGRDGFRSRKKFILQHAVLFDEIEQFRHDERVCAAAKIIFTIGYFPLQCSRYRLRRDIAFVARHQQHDRGDGAGPGQQRNRQREDRDVVVAADEIVIPRSRS